MVKVAAALLLLAVVCLTASSIVWVRGSSRAAALPDGAGADATLAAFERTNRRTQTIDLQARYGGRLELLDPRLALPTWHKHVRDEAVRVSLATKQCPPAAITIPGDASLAKAYAWQERSCASSGRPPDELIEQPPFMHPSGRSYAALARARSSWSDAQTKAHARSFHVLELAALDATSLDPEERALATISAHGWEALARGDRLVLTPSLLLLAEHGPFGLSKLRVYSRDAWDAFSHGGPIALASREGASGAAPCVQPASPELCWETRTVVERHRPALLVSTTSSVVLAVFASLALGFAYVGERRRLHGDRIHVLRTLTHELRTPATSLRLDIEPLRDAYDELPASCQEPLLRISDGIERLHRVLHRSARYMALFETKASSEGLVKLRDVPSTKVMFEELAEEWPEGVALTAGAEDGPFSTDPDWLSVAVRNLVENGARHGGPPVAVSWAFDAGVLVVRVSDGGSSPKLSLRRAVAPYDRDAKSPGLGLGLAIVDRVAHLLGGRLSHEPSPTTFELRLPANATSATSKRPA